MESILLERHGADLIKELELLYPGPYTVYFVPEENKVGCTRQLESRHSQMERQYRKKLSLPKVLFETNNLLMAAEKERENKALHGIQWDTTDYINDLKRQKVSCSKKVRTKAIANTDQAKKWTKATRQKISKVMDPIKVKVIASEVLELQWQGTRGKPGCKKIIKKTKYFRTFDSQEGASVYFRKKGIYILPEDISQILNPKMAALTRHNYTFKKA